CQSCLSVLLSGVGDGSGKGFFLVLGVGEGDGVDSTSFRLSVSSGSVLPFSSSSSLPTRRADVKLTSFKAAKTDAPRIVISVPPPDTQSFRVETPPLPRAEKYLPAAP